VGVVCRKPEGRPLRGPRCKWEDNIERDLKTLDEMAWIGLIWTGRGRRGRLLMFTVSVINFWML
jgi:hypothetical protein